jgi:hypothetical protein
MPDEKQAEMEVPCLQKTWNSGDVILPGGNAGRKTSGDGAPVLAQSSEFRSYDSSWRKCRPKSKRRFSSRAASSEFREMGCLLEQMPGEKKAKMKFVRRGKRTSNLLLNTRAESKQTSKLRQVKNKKPVPQDALNNNYEKKINTTKHARELKERNSEKQRWRRSLPRRFEERAS